MQHDHVGQAALVAVAIIGRRDDVRCDRGIRSECLHMRVGPWNREGALTLRINSRCERTSRHMITQTGQENGKRNNRPGGNRTILKTNVYYSFTMSPAQCAVALRLCILAECVQNASLAFLPGFAGHCSE